MAASQPHRENSAEAGASGANSADWIPRPDPTRLTTEQLTREIGALKEVVFTRLECVEEAIARANEDIEKHPGFIIDAIAHLKDMLGARMNGMDQLRDEKFIVIQMQFKERDERFHQAAVAFKETVERSFAEIRDSHAQQNRLSDIATNKSESNFVKQMDQLGALIQAKSKSDDEKFSDIKERVYRIEGVTIGKTDTEKVHRDNTGVWVGIASALIAFAALAMGAIGLFIANYHKV